MDNNKSTLVQDCLKEVLDEMKVAGENRNLERTLWQKIFKKDYTLHSWDDLPLIWYFTCKKAIEKLDDKINKYLNK